MTGAAAGRAGAGAGTAPARALIPMVITVITTAWGTLQMLAWLAGMIIRSSRSVRRGQTR